MHELYRNAQLSFVKYAQSVHSNSQSCQQCMGNWGYSLDFDRVHVHVHVHVHVCGNVSEDREGLSLGLIFFKNFKETTKIQNILTQVQNQSRY